MYKFCEKESSSQNAPSKNTKKPVFGSKVCQMCGKKDRRGTYANRTKDKKNYNVTGKTHESEHPLGFAPANKYNNFSRNSKPGRAYADRLPAYLEKGEFHRQHIGTGNKKQVDGSGFNSTTYRDTQEELIDNDDVATAIQINQLAYAHQPGFQDEPYGTVSDQSFEDMVRDIINFPVPNEEHTGYIERPVTFQERLEMLGSRFVTRCRRYPTKQEIKRMRNILNNR